MKKRSFIPLASLVVLSGAAAVSGTFAWFQTNRSLNLTFNDATVRSRDSNLVVTYGSSANTGMTATKGEQIQGEINLALNSTGNSQYITDISGDGTDFYKLEQGYRINDNDEKLQGVSWQIPLAINKVTAADGHYIDFTLNLSRTELTTSLGDPLEVYVGKGTKIEPANDAVSADVKAAAGARVSMKVGSGTPKLFTQFAELDTVQRWVGYEANGTTPKYESFDNTPNYVYLKEDAGSEAYQIDGYTLETVTNMVVLDTVTTDLTSNTPAHPTYLTTLSTLAVTTLNVRMWIEGTDADVGFSDENIAVNGKIKLTLDLYTLHVR